MYRRTNISSTLTNDCPGFYPIRENEAILSTDVTVFKAPESEGCAILTKPFRVDLVSCPALHNPDLTPEGKLREADEGTLRKKLRLIFQIANRNGNDSLVMGAMGCGAWRNPPHEVARIIREEEDRDAQSVALDGHTGHTGVVVFEIACLEVDPKAYIVLHRNKPSNFHIFREVFAAPS